MNRPMRIMSVVLLLVAVLFWFGPFDLFLGMGPVAALLMFPIAIPAVVLGFMGFGRRTTAAALLLCAIGLCVFSCWGLFTVAGRQRYPELAGLLPQIAGIAGIGLAIVALIVAIVPGQTAPTESVGAIDRSENQQTFK